MGRPDQGFIQNVFPKKVKASSQDVSCSLQLRQKEQKKKRMRLKMPSKLILFFFTLGFS